MDEKTAKNEPRFRRRVLHMCLPLSKFLMCGNIPKSYTYFMRIEKIESMQSWNESRVTYSYNTKKLGQNYYYYNAFERRRQKKKWKKPTVEHTELFHKQQSARDCKNEVIRSYETNLKGFFVWNWFFSFLHPWKYSRELSGILFTSINNSRRRTKTK